MVEVRRTKIVASIGPASALRGTLEEMIAAGMDVARINCSHGTMRDHAHAIQLVREAAARVGRTVGVLLDLAGPKLRIESLDAGLGELVPGEVVSIAEEGATRHAAIRISRLGVLERIGPGSTIAFADGAVRVAVDRAEGAWVEATVVQGGQLAPRKGVNFPDAFLELPALTEADYADIAFGVEAEVDFIALSFVGRAGDLAIARRQIERLGGAGRVMLVAKIERKEAVARIEEIVAASDAVMVARGDLGVEMPVERIPLLQKQIIHLANETGKPVITATQMLESMIEAGSPTRAEASDVANAILDGSDALMLSAETAVGAHPVEAVATMARIARATEREVDNQALTLLSRPAPVAHSVADAIGEAATRITRSVAARAVVALTESGHTARVLARFRPPVAILGATPDPRAARSLTLSWGVLPWVIARTPSTEVMVHEAIAAGVQLGLYDVGDLVVLVAGIPFGVRGTTNLIKLQGVGEGFFAPAEGI